MSSGLVKVQRVVDVGGSGVVQGLEHVGEEFEMASFLDLELVWSSEVWGVVGVAWEVKDQSV